MKKGIIPQKDLESIEEVIDIFNTFSSNLRFCSTYEEIKIACNLCEIGMEHILKKYPELKEILKSK